MNKFEFHDMTLYFLEGNNFWTDAGRLFGPVPFTIWDKLVYTNDQNQVAQTCDPILIQYLGKNILIDAAYGMGKLDSKTIQNEGIVGQNQTLASLERLNITPEEIDLILMTHLHNDHASGLSYKIEGKESDYALVYPKAEILVNRTEWDEIMSPPPRTKRSYRWDSWWPIRERVTLWEGYCKPMDGIELFHSKGHSPGHAIIKLSQGQDLILHLADHLMSHLHLKPLWVPAVDDFPLDTIQSKEIWINYGLKNQAYFTFYHDPDYCLIQYDEHGKEIKQSLLRSKEALAPFSKSVKR